MNLACENLSGQLVNLIGRQIIPNELASYEILTENKIPRKWGLSVASLKVAVCILEKESFLPCHAAAKN